MRKPLLMTTLLILNTTLLYAESYEEFVAQMHKEYTEFVTQMDKDFAKALGKEWKEFESSVEPSFPHPKPQNPPKAPQLPKDQEDNTPKIVINIFNIPPQNTPRLPTKPRVPLGYKALSFNFFSQPIYLVYNQKLIYRLNHFNNQSISAYWLHQSNMELNHFLQRITSYQRLLNLNDWHLYLLVYSIAKNIIHEAQNTKILTWFILNKLGYDVKLGYQYDRVYLMPSINQQIYNVAYTSIGQKKYYAFGHKGKIYTYPNTFGNTKPLDLSNTKVPYLKPDLTYRTLSFEKEGRAYRIQIPFNKNLIHLYNLYPSLDWEYYFRQPIDPITKRKLFKQLKSIMQGMSELEAVNFLLTMTQYGFQYATDPEQFGQERSLFFEESLNYPFNDCEDRSIFFGKLVKELLGLEVVALHYPNHLATAVEFKSNVKGESIRYKNRRYVICDPTYEGAPVGLAMPQFRGSKDVEIIPINY